jgi:hypothetical protein
MRGAVGLRPNLTPFAFLSSLISQSGGTLKRKVKARLLLVIEPHVFHLAAVEHTVDHHRQPLHSRVPAGRRTVWKMIGRDVSSANSRSFFHTNSRRGVNRY